MDAVIMAGGKGTRMSGFTDLPKSLLPFGDKPIIIHQIDELVSYGVEKIFIVLSNFGSNIEDCVREKYKNDDSIKFVYESSPLGTAGAFYYLKDRLSDDFIFVYGDIFFCVDISRMVNFHYSSSAKLTVFTHKNSHPYDSNIACVDGSGKITKIFKKGQVEGLYNNIVCGGLYVVNKSVISRISSPEKLDFEKDLVLGMIENSEPVFSYMSTEFVKDVGTPERYEKCLSEVVSGAHKKKCYTAKQKCIFLDRDGVINQNIPYISRLDDFILYDFTCDAIKKINDSEFLCVVLTNQPVVARGDCTIEMLETIHKKLETQLGNYGCYVDDIFYCPHHPDSGYAGEVKELKIVCDCRKPNTKMVMDAVKKYNIDLSQSYMVGDSSVDIELARRAGMKSILVKTGDAGESKKFDAKPNYICENLMESVNLILGE